MEKKSEIAAIPNKYKDTLDDLSDSSNTKSLDHSDSPNRLELIDKGSRNIPKSRDSLSAFLQEDCLDKNILIISLKLLLKFETPKYITTTTL